MKQCINIFSLNTFHSQVASTINAIAFLASFSATSEELTQSPLSVMQLPESTNS